MAFKIKDAPGKIPVALMRTYFERLVNDTAVFKANTPLGIMEINGEFSRYMDADTDALWLGFALGMRCAERLAATKANDGEV